MFILQQIKPCTVLFQVGTIAEVTTHALQKTERRTNTSSNTTTRGCMFVETTSGDAVCTRELLSNDSTRCVPDKEAGEEERSTEDATTTI